MREVVQLTHEGRRMIGTLHRPAPAAHARDLPGVLFLNAGHVPRDGHAGLWARAADVLAERGHVVARFDFPGLGDSPGALPERIETFWHAVKMGALAGDALALARWMRAHHTPSGVVLGGLCGAAITSLYALERAPAGIVGLVLMEPEFFLLESDPTEADTPAVAGRKPPLLARLLSSHTWLRIVSGANSRVGSRLPRLRRLGSRLLLRVLALPQRTNLGLVRAWRRTLDLGVPVLVLTVQDDIWDIYYRKTTEAVLGGRPAPPTLRHLAARDTSHAFTRNDGVETALREIGRFFADVFPGPAPLETAPPDEVRRDTLVR